MKPGSSFKNCMMFKMILNFSFINAKYIATRFKKIEVDQSINETATLFPSEDFIALLGGIKSYVKGQ